MDQELALAAEGAALEKAGKERDGNGEGAEALDLSGTPYAESVRLGHELYAIPGDYTVRGRTAGVVMRTSPGMMQAAC